MITIAVITTIIWLLAGQTFGYALARGISVWPSAAPAHLALQTPAIMVGNGMGAKNGILFKQPFPGGSRKSSGLSHRIKPEPLMKRSAGGNRYSSGRGNHRNRASRWPCTEKKVNIHQQRQFSKPRKRTPCYR